MDINPQQILNILITGIALASVWYWIYSLIRGVRKSDLQWWLKIIVPQGILISFAAQLIWGIIHAS